MKITWPLATREYPIPTGDEPGAFGVQRWKYVHPGVDLYCEDGTEVYAVEDGIVVSVEDFTGVNEGTPWWNDTEAVLVEGESGVINYGEVEALVKEGDKVKQGQLLAKVKMVMKEYKGNPMSMLHFELYKHGTKEAVDWYKREQRPENLLDPTDLLLSICHKN